MTDLIKTLWLLECLDGRYGRLITFYAKDKQEAESFVEQYLALHSHLIKKSLTPKPRGFLIIQSWRPGTMVYKED